MSEESEPKNWDHARNFLIEKFSTSSQVTSVGSVSFDVDDEDWLLEVTPQGLLVCQSGYDLDDMKSVLSDGTAEDLGSDELAKQAKFYLQQTVSKYRARLIQDGFTERIEMNDEYVAMMFERSVNLDHLENLEQVIRRYQARFSSSA